MSQSQDPPTPSRLEWIPVPQSVLGMSRAFGVYLPAGYTAGPRRYPVLYLFRGEEREWAGRQDGREGLVSVLDRLIGSGTIQPLVAVLPGFMAPGSELVGTPVNWSGASASRGAGTGRFEDHFFEVKRLVEERFAVLYGPRHTAADGFSMGGFSAVLLAMRHPGLFGSVGAYDGSFMWPRQVDPRVSGGRWDRLWFSQACAPLFRREGLWEMTKMERHNAIPIIESARGSHLRQLRRIRFHVRSVEDEIHGNFDRTVRLAEALARAGIANSFSGASLRLSSRARHTWKWADIHLAGVLPRHDRVFRGL